MKYRVQDRQLKTKKGGLKEIRSPQSSVNKKVFQQKKRKKKRQRNIEDNKKQAALRSKRQ